MEINLCVPSENTDTIYTSVHTVGYFEFKPFYNQKPVYFAFFLNMFCNDVTNDVTDTQKHGKECTHTCYMFI